MAVHPKAMLARRRDDGIAVSTLEHRGISELLVTALPDGDTGLHSMFEKAWRVVRGAGATVLRQDVFGIPAERDIGPTALREVCGEVDWPVAWLEEGASQGESLTGTHLHAVAGAPVRRIRDRGETVGSVFEDAVAAHCHLAGLCPRDSTGPRAAQASAVLERIEHALGQAGMDFSNVIRTWFYVDHILDWYGEFNAVRSRFFQERGVFDRLLPASTGVGGGNRAGAALLADVLALKPRDGHSVPRAIVVPSPMQCAAMQYRSSFSRAVEVDYGDHRRLSVSGTASIDPQGATARVGDVRGQVELTLDVIEALLRSRRMGWGDVTRAIAYVKHGADSAVYRRCMETRGIGDLPEVVAENDICRDDLLFEMEVDAWRAGTERQARPAGTASPARSVRRGSR
jgi:enamine deaminase RidA (YjgF/YER057c/UK114 family)